MLRSAQVEYAGHHHDEYDQCLREKKTISSLRKVCYMYVGHTISADGIEANQDKVDKIRNWSTPCDVQELRIFYLSQIRERLC